MSAQVTKELDLVSVGRVVVDLYPAEDGRAPKDVENYRQYLGGSPTNVAVAAARAGLRSAVVTRTGDDLFHEFVVDQLASFGVDARWVRAVPGRRTTLAVCDLRDPSSPALQFFQDTPPPTDALDAAELVAASSSSHMLWITASGFATDRSAAAHDAALAAAEHTFLDLDHRPDFWADERALRDRLRPVLPQVDTVVGNEKECSIALGRPGTAEELGRVLLDEGPRLAVVKRGEEGVVAVTRDAVLSVPAVPVRVVNGLGAGDAFGGWLVSGMSAGVPLDVTLRRATAAGAIVASRRGCSVAMPTPAEVDELLERHGR
ncbi:PfkB domain protein [Beutenbergia cavernae DSM 12333]|uniref:PfkB domain protein n=1 Tax=Beutenbergia cavernae (strain ATCC BAA-8 / DSM 12333 / CCUG 43141 / JCM 11478 / NBRC 16432 / NCIMB 13614 / HKI 0122) TaxID=471853 RepID=C5C669_BEUC1|nr:PfkB family carbohydrate kinase [Beutenbergia cavernae]ACQ82427.1 PfkB domain protein [Beutenbergia cavernae DSM 12333]